MSRNKRPDKISDENADPQKALEPPVKKLRKRKKKNLAIKARRLINRVTHYHVMKDGEERWIPIFEVENYNDVIEFEKYVAKIAIGSEEDLFVPEADSVENADEQLVHSITDETDSSEACSSKSTQIDKNQNQNQEKIKRELPDPQDPNDFIYEIPDEEEDADLPETSSSPVPALQCREYNDAEMRNAVSEEGTSSIQLNVRDTLREALNSKFNLESNQPVTNDGKESSKVELSPVEKKVIREALAMHNLQFTETFNDQTESSNEVAVADSDPVRIEPFQEETVAEADIEQSEIPADEVPEMVSVSNDQETTKESHEVTSAGETAENMTEAERKVQEKSLEEKIMDGIVDSVVTESTKTTLEEHFQNFPILPEYQEMNDPEDKNDRVAIETMSQEVEAFVQEDVQMDESEEKLDESPEKNHGFFLPQSPDQIDKLLKECRAAVELVQATKNEEERQSSEEPDDPLAEKPNHVDCSIIKREECLGNESSQERETSPEECAPKCTEEVKTAGGTTPAETPVPVSSPSPVAPVVFNLMPKRISKRRKSIGMRSDQMEKKTSITEVGTDTSVSVKREGSSRAWSVRPVREPSPERTREWDQGKERRDSREISWFKADQQRSEETRRKEEKRRERRHEEQRSHVDRREERGKRRSREDARKDRKHERDHPLFVDERKSRRSLNAEERTSSRERSSSAESQSKRKSERSREKRSSEKKESGWIIPSRSPERSSKWGRSVSPERPSSRSGWDIEIRPSRKDDDAACDKKEKHPRDIDTRTRVKNKDEPVSKESTLPTKSTLEERLHLKRTARRTKLEARLNHVEELIKRKKQEQANNESPDAKTEIQKKEKGNESILKDPRIAQRLQTEKAAQIEQENQEIDSMLEEKMISSQINLRDPRIRARLQKEKEAKERTELEAQAMERKQSYQALKQLKLTIKKTVPKDPRKNAQWRREIEKSQDKNFGKCVIPHPVDLVQNTNNFEKSEISNSLEKNDVEAESKSVESAPHTWPEKNLTGESPSKNTTPKDPRAEPQRRREKEKSEKKISETQLKIARNSNEVKAKASDETNISTHIEGKDQSSRVREVKVPRSILKRKKSVDPEALEDQQELDQAKLPSIHTETEIQKQKVNPPPETDCGWVIPRHSPERSSKWARSVSVEPPISRPACDIESRPSWKEDGAKAEIQKQKAKSSPEPECDADPFGIFSAPSCSDSSNIFTNTSFSTDNKINEEKDNTDKNEKTSKARDNAANIVDKIISENFLTKDTLRESEVATEGGLECEAPIAESENNDFNEDSMPVLDELEFFDADISGNDLTSTLEENTPSEADQPPQFSKGARVNDAPSTVVQTSESTPNLNDNRLFPSPQKDLRSTLWNNDYLNADIINFEDTLQPSVSSSLEPKEDTPRNTPLIATTSLFQEATSVTSSTSQHQKLPAQPPLKEPPKPHSESDDSWSSSRSFPRLRPRSIDEDDSPAPSPITYSFGSVSLRPDQPVDTEANEHPSESTHAQPIQQKSVLDCAEDGLENEHPSADKTTTDKQAVKVEVIEKVKVTRKRSGKKETSSSEFASTWKAQNRKHIKKGSKNSKEDSSKADKAKKERVGIESSKKEKTKKEKIYVKTKREPDEYEVEKILNKRVRLGKVEYEVKWVGYNSSENTWEEVKNLQNCPDLVKEYEKKE
ncbi:Oidioi.mRNA.OKI2018_I69.XSR.g13904.t1.cds [Oikopleura dioica]|uniref:Oidioi.mRNA.OKI2018_I69.XSR.g13904.t1.cds n=1 Tax=Oikopleura dioica TaxID=34765 RepID=A0ABN7SD14_OIKDI|nr:Oidioi.mRNA.OKI2018_I69.XSR.g13904.t1.cds [Oikopleura dioica]